MDIKAEIKAIDKQIKGEETAIKYHKIQLGELTRKRNRLADLMEETEEENDQNGATDIH